MKRENNKIRNRKSYLFFKNMYMEIKNKKPDEVLKSVFSTMNHRKVFGSRTMAFYFEESMNQVINDANNELI